MAFRFLTPARLRRLQLRAAALEAVEVPVMIAEADGEQRIVYVNAAARTLFAEHAGELNSGLAGADVRRAEGGSVHRFHRDPAKVREVLSTLRQRGGTHTARIELGGRHLETHVRPIVDGGATVGFLAHWFDRTDVERRAQETAAGTKERLVRTQENVAQIAAAVEELRASASEVARTGAALSAVADQVAASARNGDATFERAIEAMELMSARIRSTAGALSELAERTRVLDGVASAIGGIADQTNLLALNAAIEASRAGAAGRGFAVVADEVRQLAGRAGNLAHQIAEGISEVRAGVGDAVRVIQEGLADSERSVELGAQARHAVAEIIEGNGQVARGIGEIATAMAQEEEAVEEISARLHDLASASAAEEATTSGRAVPSAERRFGLDGARRG
jgi:methyl-accepting chemotaxis protein